MYVSGYLILSLRFFVCYPAHNFDCLEMDFYNNMKSACMIRQIQFPKHSSVKILLPVGSKERGNTMMKWTECHFLHITNQLYKKFGDVTSSQVIIRRQFQLSEEKGRSNILLRIDEVNCKQSYNSWFIT